MVKTKLTLDMNRKSITPQIMAKQLDSGRIVEITVNCDGVLVTDFFDETRILTSKGENSFYSSSLAENPIIENLTNGKTTWKIPSDVLEIAGIVMGELRLLKGNFVVSTMPFEICVEATVSSNEAKTPKNAVDFIKKAEEAAEKAKKSAEEANQSANSAQTSAEVAEDLLAAKEDKLPVITELRLDPTKTPIGCVRYKAGADFSITDIVSRDNEIEEISYNTHYRISNGSIITVYHESIPFFGKQRHKIIVTLDTTWNVDSSSYVCGNLKYTAEVNSDGSFTDGNFIYETYATKEEIVGTLGTINEVLATLVEVE